MAIAVTVNTHPSLGTGPHELHAGDNFRIEDLQELLVAGSGVPIWRQRLFHGQEQLAPEQPLAELAEEGGALVLELVPRRGRQRQASPERLRQLAAQARASIADAASPAARGG